eukprot:1443-Heterococcus_DN1.PRE.5
MQGARTTNPKLCVQHAQPRRNCARLKSTDVQRVYTYYWQKYTVRIQEPFVALHTDQYFRYTQTFVSGVSFACQADMPYGQADTHCKLSAPTCVHVLLAEVHSLQSKTASYS